MWKCIHCETNNEDRNPSCIVCGNPRPAPETPRREPEISPRREENRPRSVVNPPPVRPAPPPRPAPRPAPPIPSAPAPEPPAPPKPEKRRDGTDRTTIILMALIGLVIAGLIVVGVLWFTVGSRSRSAQVQPARIVCMSAENGASAASGPAFSAISGGKTDFGLVNS